MVAAKHIPDELWERIEPHLPQYRRSRKGGRPRVCTRRVFAGIVYVLRNGCTWQSAPKEYGSPATLHRYYQDWARRGTLDRLQQAELKGYEDLF